MLTFIYLEQHTYYQCVSPLLISSLTTTNISTRSSHRCRSLDFVGIFHARSLNNSTNQASLSQRNYITLFVSNNLDAQKCEDILLYFLIEISLQICKSSHL